VSARVNNAIGDGDDFFPCTKLKDLLASPSPEKRVESGYSMNERERRKTIEEGLAITAFPRRVRERQ